MEIVLLIVLFFIIAVLFAVREHQKSRKELEQRNLVTTSTISFNIPERPRKSYTLHEFKNIKMANVMLEDLNERFNYFVEDDELIYRKATNLLNLNQNEYETQFILMDSSPNSDYFFSIIEPVKIDHDRRGAELLRFDVAVAPRSEINNKSIVKNNQSLSEIIDLFNDWLNILSTFKELSQDEPDLNDFERHYNFSSFGRKQKASSNYEDYVLNDENEIRQISSTLDEFIRLLESQKDEENKQDIDKIQNGARHLQQEVESGAMSKSKAERWFLKLGKMTKNVLGQVGVNLFSQVLYEGIKLLVA